ncbi:MAG TPA: ATP-binding protein [Chloroflexota bacterium]|nr:ATP-binding protein [Chloroflexota bacterium]
MRRALARLRWQLTLSHLIAIVVTLVSMVAALILIAGSWIAVQTSPDREAANDARIVARSIGPLVDAGGDSESLNVVLRGLAQGKVRAQVGPGPFAPEPAYRIDGIGPSLRGLDYVAIVGPDGTIVASSEPGGASFDPPERAEWTPIIERARGGERSTARLAVRRDGPGPVALGAFPIGGAAFDGPGWAHTAPAEQTAVVVVGKSEIGEISPFRAIVRGIALFTAATIAVLASAFLFALGSAALVGYILSRQLVRRLERLSGAVEALASGELSRRVEEGRDDEVGQLSRRFNVMADRLATTVAELDARTREAESALAAKRELVANVSHELRTPLASISGHAESLLLLGEGASAARREESLSVLHREARQLSRLVDDLFLLSTTESGGLPLTIRDVDVGQILEEVTATFRPLARREGQITIVSDVEPDLPLARGDRERIVQVLGNLVRNALRYTAEGGIISLRAARAGDLVRVTVEDTGAGIPPEQLARIFERFYRGDDARDRASGGAGLGLAIVRELVEAMGGAVAADSVVGEGSRFSFTLQVASTPTSPAQNANGGLTKASR